MIHCASTKNISTMKMITPTLHAWDAMMASMDGMTHSIAVIGAGDHIVIGDLMVFGVLDMGIIARIGGPRHGIGTTIMDGGSTTLGITPTITHIAIGDTGDIPTIMAIAIGIQEVEVTCLTIIIPRGIMVLQVEGLQT